MSKKVCEGSPPAGEVNWLVVCHYRAPSDDGNSFDEYTKFSVVCAQTAYFAVEEIRKLCQEARFTNCQVFREPEELKAEND